MSLIVAIEYSFVFYWDHGESICLYSGLLSDHMCFIRNITSNFHIGLNRNTEYSYKDMVYCYFFHFIRNIKC